MELSSESCAISGFGFSDNEASVSTTKMFTLIIGGVVE
jgi:hypothetical protein